MKKILTVGGATRDIFISPQPIQMLHLSLQEGRRSFLVYETGRKVEVSELDYHTGGGATNTAVAFKHLGFDVSAFFKIGPDAEGDFIVRSMKERGINVDHVARDEHVATATSFIIPTEAGDRVALVYRGSNVKMEEKDLPLKALSGIDQLYVTSLPGKAESLLLPMVRAAKKEGVSIAVNPGSAQLTTPCQTLRKSLEYIDILIVNDYEARQCMTSLALADKSLQVKLLKLVEAQKQIKGQNLPLLLQHTIMHEGLCYSLPFFFEEILSRGPKCVVVTNGKEGVYVADKNHIFFHPAVTAPCICTLGAGDAFGSTFVGWLLNGNSVEDAVRAGVINSSSVVGYIGTKTGLLEYKTLQKRVKELDTKLLQRFPLVTSGQ